MRVKLEYGRQGLHAELPDERIVRTLHYKDAPPLNDPRAELLAVLARPNGSASLFTAAKISHLGLLPQGQPERQRRAARMVAQMDAEGFGHCTFYGECQEACPKEISIDTISRMNRDYLGAALTTRAEKAAGGTG